MLVWVGRRKAVRGKVFCFAVAAGLVEQNLRIEQYKDELEEVRVGYYNLKELHVHKGLSLSYYVVPYIFPCLLTYRYFMKHSTSIDCNKQMHSKI